MYRPNCLDAFPRDLADSILEMALERTHLSKERLENLTAPERERLDDVTWRLVTAADVSDSPCA